MRNRQLHRFADILATADIADERFHDPARFADGLGGLFEHVALVVEHDHASAFGRERLGHRTPDTLGSAGDDDALA